MSCRYVLFFVFFFFFKQKTSDEMRIRDWSSDVCSSDLLGRGRVERDRDHLEPHGWGLPADEEGVADRRCALELGEDSRRDAEVDIVDPPPLPEIGRASCRERVGQYV